MAFNPNQGNFPYPPSQTGEPYACFNSSSQGSQGQGHPMYPQGRGGYPPPSASPVGFGPPMSSGPLPYSICPGAPSHPTSDPSMGFQPGLGVRGYPPGPSSNPSPYPPGLGASPYPPAPGTNPSPYPPGPGLSPYPPGPETNSSPYAPGPITTPSSYPPSHGTNPHPYPQGPGINTSPYPPGPGTSPSTYLPGPSTSPSPYPPGPSISQSPYPSGPGTNPSPYPPGPSISPYPPAPGTSPSTYPPAPGTSPSLYPQGPGINTSSYLPGPVTGPSPYPPGRGTSPSPYLPGPGTGPSTYPPSPSVSPSSYPPGPGTNPSPYPPVSGSYPSGEVPYSSTSSSYLNPTTQNYSNTFHSSSSSQQNPNFSQHHSSLGSRAGSMWPYQERATVRPNVSFDPSSDASVLRKAMKGFGTDEAAIVRVLGRRTNLERQQIIPKYQQAYGKDLIKDLRSELSGNFLGVVESLMVPLPEFLARELHDAVVGIGTNETTLIEILCSSDNNTLRAVKSSYQSLYRKPLETDLRGDTSGYFLRLMVAMAAASRDETTSNISMAPTLAQSLYAAGVKKLGTDEAEFIRILSNYSYPVLRCVFQEYSKISGGKTFESAIKAELSGDLCRGMLALYECINNRAAFFSHQLHEAMRGMGTDDRHLIRIVTWRAEIDMGNIKDEFKVKYGKKLENVISSETSSDYKKILLALIQD